MNEIDPSVTISPHADIGVSTRGSKLVMGPRGFIDSFVRIRFVGGTGDIRIGADAYINAGSVIYSGNGITMGDAVLIAANCTLAPTNHEFRDPTRTILSQRFMPSRGGILIEDDVWIGANSVVLDGAVIRKGAVIAAGSVVHGEVEAYTVVGGSPLRVIKRRA